MRINNDQKYSHRTCKAISLDIVRETMQLLSGKWKIQIIAFLVENGRTRFMEIQRGVSGISCKVLSRELQQMEHDGIISRLANDPKLTVVEYELTKFGQTLKSLLYCITDWGVEYSKGLHSSKSENNK